MHGGRASLRVSVRGSLRTALAVGAAVVALAGAASAGALALAGGSGSGSGAGSGAALAGRRSGSGGTAARSPAVGGGTPPPAAGPQPGTPAVAASPAPPPSQVPAPTDLPLPGCPPPPYTGPPAAPPWHPAHLVPDAQLPPAPAAPPGRNPAGAISGKGMWIWQVGATDHGNTAAIVSDAGAAGLHQIWVRVADSRDGFYGAGVLARLVPAAHRAGLAVIGWGFPYLFDPVADAAWTAAALDWRAPDGQGLDGWSADIETSSEGVALSPQRVAVYLGRVRTAEPRALLVATVFPPTDEQMTRYPFATMAPYVDAFAPMLYWGCTQPALAVEQAVARLAPLGPLVHVIGQAYDMGPYGGRRGAPAPGEIDAFMLAARQFGAVGASFWSWQSIDTDEWSAVRGFSWR